MKFLKRLRNEKGYLLLENVVTLTIITVLLLVIYPLIAEWFVVRENSKEEVELSRVLYEASYEWPNYKLENSNVKVKSSSASLFVESQNQNIGVEVYEKKFKR